MKKLISYVFGLLILTNLAYSFGFGAVSVTQAAAPERGPVRTDEPLPFNDEPYVHPSGAFTFGMPEGWEILSEAETSAAVTDGNSLVGATFADAGEVYRAQEIEQYIGGFLTNFFSTIADDYKITHKKVLSDGSTFVAIEYTNSEYKGNADFIFQQQDTVMFVLLLTTSNYEEISPTWNKIIESYSVDPEAAKTASQAATPTPAPSHDNYAPQPGRSRVYVGNDYNETLTFTINNTENKVTPGSEASIDLDPGKYTYTISIPGGAVNGEVEVEPDQSWAIYVDEHGSVYGPFQVYP